MAITRQLFDMTNTMRIPKFRLGNTLLLVTIAALLALQWTTGHIHLAENQTHAGDHHHQIEASAHHLSDYDVTPTNSAHSPNHVHIIEFDRDYSFQKRDNGKNLSTVVVASVFHPPLSSSRTSINVPIIINTKLSFFDRSMVNPRAPPVVC